MFAVNDYVVYGGNGVCKVQAVGKPRLNGVDQNALYYSITTVGSPSSMTIYVQVDNPRVAIRRILSREEAEQMIDSIPEMESIRIKDEKDRDKIFNQAVNSCECRDWMQLIKTVEQINIRRVRENKNKSRVGEAYVKAAKEKLIGEFSISLGIPKEQVDGYIARRIKAMESN